MLSQVWHAAQHVLRLVVAYEHQLHAILCWLIWNVHTQGAISSKSQQLLSIEVLKAFELPIQ